VERRVAIGVDAGGTKVLGVVADGSGKVVDEVLDDTPADDAEASADTIVSVAVRLAERHPDAIALGVGAAGMVTRDGVMRFAPNVAWREYPLRAHVEDKVDLPTVVENDGNVAAWGEFRFGAAAAAGATEVLMVTVGTGIGGGIVSGGRLLHGASGFAGEIGHIIVEPGGALCGCGNYGCWEQVAAGRAIDRMGKAAAREHPESDIARLAGGDPDAVTGPIVTRAARSGDPMAVRVLASVGRRLGEGIAGLVNILDPEIVVIGGGAIVAGDLLLDPARAAFREAVEAPIYRPEVPIVAAGLGRHAGAVGAAALALEVHGP
jgi:glucokinase